MQRGERHPLFSFVIVLATHTFTIIDDLSPFVKGYLQAHDVGAAFPIETLLPYTTKRRENINGEIVI